MAVRDRAAFDVDDLLVDAELARHRDRHDRERFVDLETLDVPQRPAGALERDLHRGNGAQAEHPGLDGGDAERHDAGARGDPVRVGERAVRHQHRRCAAVQARCVAGGDRAVRAERRFQFRERVERRIGAGRLVPRERHARLALQDLDRRQLGVELPVGQRGGKALLRAQRPAVLAAARDVELAREILGMPPGMLVGECIDEAVAQHAVEDRGLAHPVAPAGAVEQVRRALHAFHAAGDGRVREAQHDLLRGIDDRLRAGAADPVDRQRGNRDRNAGADRRLPCGVHLVAGLDHVAHHDRVDGRAIQTAAPQGLAHGDRAELGRGRVLQGAVERADRRPDGVADDDFACTHDAFLDHVDMGADGRPRAVVRCASRKEARIPGSYACA